jgi:hypothetical protein
VPVRFADHSAKIPALEMRVRKNVGFDVAEWRTGSARRPLSDLLQDCARDMRLTQNRDNRSNRAKVISNSID